MVYSLNFSKQSLKELAKINEPYYSSIKQAIINLTKNPRPQVYKKLKGRLQNKNWQLPYCLKYF